jgi:hypothetical protein
MRLAGSHDLFNGARTSYSESLTTALEEPEHYHARYCLIRPCHLLTMAVLPLPPDCIILAEQVPAQAGVVESRPEPSWY